ncbi:MAG: glycoside hydrolase family 27 protein [Chitinophagaceae bacterium]|nr:glycoside hydrolase family 27 protein [Chitinophagaceae bacterium]
MKNILAFFLLCSVTVSAQKFEGLALTPPMGWNSWNTFKTDISDKLVREIADDMVNSGMKDAGYTYIVLDDGWMAKERNRNGDLVPDPKKFPNGLKPVIDYVHAKGLKFGLYNCAGTQTCAGYPGTRGYEYQDARFYASLEIDYLKYDWCNTEGITAKEAYSTMSKALKVAGRPVIFSLCEWGDNQPWNWAKNIGQLWRISGDIYHCFDCIFDHGTWKDWGVTYIIDMHKDIRQFAGPGHWNDFDMMEVGNGMTVGEDRAHFSMWSMLASPLIAGNDLRNMSAETKAILTNKEVIAINQDSLGVQAYLYSQKDSVDTWIKPLSGNDVAICFLNRSKNPFTVSYDFGQHPVTDSVSKMNINFNSSLYKIRDVWMKKEMGNTSKLWSASVQGHDVVLLHLTMAKPPVKK